MTSWSNSKSSKPTKPASTDGSATSDSSTSFIACEKMASDMSYIQTSSGQSNSSILPRLKLFRQQPHGCPAGSSAGSSDICFHPTDAEGDPDLAAWDEKLDKMVYAFEYIASGKSWEYEMTLEQEAAEDRKVAEGLELFGKYFRGLWN
jgi:hypothetical protein